MRFDSLLRSGQFAEAETILQSGVKADPEDPTLRRLLAQFLNAQGRRHEASEHVLHLIRLRVVQPHEVLSLVDLSGPFSLVSYDSIESMGPETLFGLGQARMMHLGSRATPDEVLQLLNKVAEKNGDHPAVVAFMGRVLSENAMWEPFAAWQRGLPEMMAGKQSPGEQSPGERTLQDEPEFWQAIGNGLSHQKKHGEAIRAWAETLRRDPTHRAALRSMIATMENDLADDQVDPPTIARLRQWLADLDQVFRIARDADVQQSTWVAQKMQDWLRPWESAAWMMRAAQMTGQMSNIAPQLDRRRTKLLAWESQSTAQQIADARVKRSLGFPPEDFPMSDWASQQPGVTSVAEEVSSANQTPTNQLVLRDIARDVGVDTTFVSGFPVEGGDFFLYQANGGGLAALDYDLDGRCDVYLAQAGGAPNEENSIANQMFRQWSPQQYVETTDVTGTGDRGFGQGVCVGDVNQDGFADLIVANIGINSVYINQGDGTFQRDLKRVTSNDRGWTSSIGLADFSGDGLPEMVEINYIDDPSAYTTRCTYPYSNCQPQTFRVAADRMLVMQPNGQLAEWRAVCDAMKQSPKFGFGLIIANFDDQCGNDFFVSNDGDLNHFWKSQCLERDGVGMPTIRNKLIETASLAGCAVGRAGNSQACMGIASGDFNRDGQLDLHVTNFHRESVNLFLQTSAGFFSDEATRFGLRDASSSVLGFGTQAADFDNDGWLDLSVLNGHLFDKRSDDSPFQMLPQLFAGSDQGFRPIPAESMPEYWQRPQLGRALATLDFNSDGRIDLLANHLDHGVALLKNEGESGHWVQFQLVGTRSERDAVGAEVTVLTREKDATTESWVGVQVGGDGLMCTNESLVHLGLGDAGSIERVTIRWPSGFVQVAEVFELNRRYLVIEGQDPDGHGTN